ncbi:response regulator [Candidatus Uhrbacteria bacterium]|nr:response regulator [Candidatus Uhrbacteria bacterium]
MDAIKKEGKMSQPQVQVLIIMPEKAQQYVMQKQLQYHCDCRVLAPQSHSSGAEIFLKLLATQSAAALPDLIIADFRGSWWGAQAFNTTAFNFITWVRQTHPKIKILGLITLDDPAMPDAQQAVSNGLVHGLLSKPWGLQDLKAAVDSLRSAQ